MRKILLLVPIALIAGLLALALLPRSLQIDRPSLWWDHSANALLELTPDGEIVITHGPCVGMRQQQERHQVVVEEGSFFFPERQVSQPYQTGALLSGLVRGDETPWFSVAQGGPIPAGRYELQQFHPIGVCGLQP